jgi:hypothetical protein
MNNDLSENSMSLLKIFTQTLEVIVQNFKLVVPKAESKAVPCAALVEVVRRVPEFVLNRRKGFVMARYELFAWQVSLCDYPTVMHLLLMEEQDKQSK